VATADAQNRIVTINRSAMVITGNADVLPIGRSATEVLQLPQGFAETIGQDLDKVRSRRTDYSLKRPDGRQIDIGLSVASLPMPDGSRGYLYTFQDVTDMKRFEHNARLQQRLAAVGEMAAGIAHEIRNPLASMSGSMQVLRHELSLSPDQSQLFDIVLRESDRLNLTIRDFLSYARPQEGQPGAMDLTVVVRDAGQLLKNSPDCTSTHRIRVEAPDSLPIDAVEPQIRQIVWNLATNGLRAMPKGGTLTLSAERISGDERTPMVAMRVADEGVGIPAQDLERIFQPFHGGFAKGAGLGLAIVHRIVTEHAGSIHVSSEVGRGTVFEVRLPVRQRAEAAA